MTQIADERAGLPSASSGEMWYHCGGCLQKENEAPAETPGAETLQGQEIHDAMESEDFSGLDEDGHTIAEKLTEQKQQVLDAWQKEFDEPTVGLTTIKEERLWIKDRKTFKPTCSAKLDIGFIGRRAGLALDHKTGFLSVTPAFRNIQARIQALSIWHEFPRIQSVRAVISSYRFRGKIDPVDYNPATLLEAEQELVTRLRATKQAFPSRTAGPWCKYCRGKAFCPEQATYSMIATVHTGSAPMAKADIYAKVHTLDLPQLAFIRERITMIRNFCDAVDERMKGFSREDLASVGWGLVPTGNMRLIPDIQALWAEIHKSGLLNDDEFRKCLEPVLGRLETLLVDKITTATKCTKKAALAAAKRIIEPAITLVPKAPTLKPLKGELPEGGE